MSNTVLVKSYNEPDFNMKEIYRYMGLSKEDEEISKEVLLCINECKNVLSYKVCYREFDININEDKINLGFSDVSSRGLSKNLDGCEKIILFAATVGIKLDFLIKKYGTVSPLKALAFQAIGAERIESLCDMFCNDIKNGYEESGYFTRPRFSPGYGDLPLSLQRDIFRVLDCPRKIGLTLNESLLMSPSKSVTAIVGISDCDRKSPEKKCSRCEKLDCPFRSK